MHATEVTQARGRRIKRLARGTPMTTTTKATPTLPTTGFVRLETILHHYQIGRSTWWAGVKAGTLPRSYKLGPRTTAWKAEDVLALIQKISDAESSSASRKNAEANTSWQPPATTQRRAKNRGRPS